MRGLWVWLWGALRYPVRAAALEIPGERVGAREERRRRLLALRLTTGDPSLYVAAGVGFAGAAAFAVRSRRAVADYPVTGSPDQAVDAATSWGAGRAIRNAADEASRDLDHVTRLAPAARGRTSSTTATESA